MKEIGGYFELELPRLREHYENPVRLNSGRNCLEYILRARRYRRVYLPSYCCDALLEPLRRTNTEFRFYSINENFEPIICSSFKKNDALLYINYYGINDDKVLSLVDSTSNLIVDNSQAFFSQPLHEIDTYYSPRKFFGVPDGGYLLTNLQPPHELKQDRSFRSFIHLLQRIDVDAQAGYGAYRINEDRINRLPLRLMSKLTQRVLCSIEYESARIARVENFKRLDTALASRNILKFQMQKIHGPLVYPLLVKGGALLRKYLLQQKIYCAIYWPNLPASVDAASFEFRLQQDLIALPIDQRLSVYDMNILIDIISEFDKMPHL